MYTKAELFLWDTHLINFFVASIPLTYDSIIYNINMCEIFTLKKKLCTVQTKEIKFIKLRSMKEENTNFDV